MSSGNRTVKYENLLKSLRKHYKPLAEPPARSVLEHLLYACCLEDAKVEQADEGFAKLQQTYFDWNEVRVTTVVELAEALKPLPFPMQAASRIKQCLQSIFESRYQYDIDDMKKANLGKATAELEAWKGMSPFVVAYVSQHALGGHSIPASQLICEAMWQCEILSATEIQKKTLPGIERAIPKNKGVEFAGLMHQFASDLYHHPRAATPLAVLKDMGVVLKTKPKTDEPASSSKSKGTVTKSESTALSAKDSSIKKPSEADSAESKSAASTPSKTKEDSKPQKASAAAKPMAAGATGKEQRSKEAKTQPKSVSKLEQAKEVKSKDSKPQSKPHSKASAGKSSSDKSAPVKSEKGSKSKLEKGKSTASKSDTSKSEKGKPGKGKPQKDLTQKGKADKGSTARPSGSKGNSQSAKSGNSKPVKKDSKDTGKASKGQTKGTRGSVGTNLTKKKPR